MNYVSLLQKENVKLKGLSIKNHNHKTNMNNNPQKIAILC